MAHWHLAVSLAGGYLPDTIETYETRRDAEQGLRYHRDNAIDNWHELTRVIDPWGYAGMPAPRGNIRNGFYVLDYCHGGGGEDHWEPRNYAEIWRCTDTSCQPDELDY